MTTEKTSPAVWRKLLQTKQSALRENFLNDSDTARLLKSQAKLVDHILQAVWVELNIPNEISLIAVGGYGRGELFPYSDIDLLILIPANSSIALEATLEPMIGFFWDIGLAIGHSVRNPSECLVEAASDITVRTNLLESRWLAGDKSAYSNLMQKLSDQLDVCTFFQDKILEQKQRHRRFNDTAYNLEPNVKESPGGLRDLHTIIWITQSLGIGSCWSALVEDGLLTAREARQLRRHELNLSILRIRLHYLAQRREDRLLFDYQKDLATDLGFVNTPKKRASEQLMQKYYRSVKFVSVMNEILLESLQEKIFVQAPRIIEINTNFQSRNGWLEAKSMALLQREPSVIFETFLVLQQHPELKGMSAAMLRTLWRVKSLVNRDFRQNPVNKKLFLEILHQPNEVSNALRKMNRYDILGRFIPAFGRIVGQMQHDLFHVYTVDEHILNVFSNVRRFTHVKYSHEFPLCSELISTFEQPELIYIAALFHDIAKGRGGDHSVLGMRDAKRFCKDLGLNKEDGNFIAWLVEQHLYMSSTAQKSDLSDPDVITAFAQRVGDIRHLVALYLLTVADIRGTSPAVWNAWKAKLLENLFLMTRRHLQGTQSASDSVIASRKSDAINILKHYAILPESYQALWSTLGEVYFLRHDAQEVAWHTRSLLAHFRTQKPIVKARLSPAGDGIQVMIYAQQHEGIFANICGFFDRLGYNIVEARIQTTRLDYALDSFLVLDNSNKDVKYRDLLSYMEYELAKKINSESNVKPEQPRKGRVSRQLKHFPMKPEVSLGKVQQAGQQTLSIMAGDGPGLLSQIALILLKNNATLHTARISTLGHRAEDTFVISAPYGKQLSQEQSDKILEDLISTI